jgi:hypothetical protein
MYYGIQIATHTAAIKTTPIERDGFNCVIRRLSIDCICQLDLTTNTRRLIAKDVKDVGRQSIAPNAGKV